MSLPSRERGLKLEYDNNKYLVDVVAPLAGAWIEIIMDVATMDVDVSLPSRERGLKSFHIIGFFCSVLRRSPRGSVD